MQSESLRAAARRTVSLAAIALAASLSHPASASAAGLITGFGGPSGFGPAGQCLPRNDDSYSGSINIDSVFPTGLNFFGTPYHSIFVNTNGNISFGTGISQYTPNAFPGAPQPIIAPYWADLDTRRTGDFGGGSCQNDTDNEVWWALDTTGHRIVVTWYNVGYYSFHTDKRVSFQLILSQPAMCGSGVGGVGNFDVEFRFNRCEWETGDASGGTNGFGGTPAQSGFDSGMAMYMGSPAWVSLPHSRMPGIAAALCRDTNAMPGEPGVWRFSVRGGAVMCPGAGAACTVPNQQGLCAQGLTNCSGAGAALSCVQVNHPATERCNGLDDNCDGTADEGSGICGAVQSCVQGVCVDRCVEGSCFANYTCDTTSGVCVESACLGMTCPAGQVCRGGACRGPCDGITCPTGTVCRSGQCQDPCAGVTCSADDVCENGICVPHCGPCRTCGTAQECGPAGACVATGCSAVTCGAGEACVAGACVDACTGAVCPTGQQCVGGACVDGASAPDDAGVAVGDDAGEVAGDDASDVLPGSDDGGTVSADAARRGDASGDARATGRVHPAGCGCRTTGSTGGGSRGSALLGLAGAAWVSGRARRRQRAA